MLSKTQGKFELVRKINNKSIAHDPPFCFEYGEMHPGNLSFQSPLTNQVLLHKKSKWTICLAISLHLVI